MPGARGAVPNLSSVTWVTLAAPPLCPLALGKRMQGWRGWAHTIRVARAQRAPASSQAAVPLLEREQTNPRGQ